jgi:3',5'-cyclic AMP phosphodiesterase CpdA
MIANFRQVVSQVQLFWFRNLLLLMLLFAVSQSITASATPLPKSSKAKGTVFEDANGNSKFDAGEKGVPGVLVSNQREVVQTDAAGKYEIAVDDETVIFITKPADYAVPLDQNNVPKFYYVHMPNGSPKLKFAGVEPTGKLPKTIDFALVKTAKVSEFDVLVFADTQPQTRQEVDYVRDDVVAQLVGIDVAFGVTLGDIMYDELDLWDRQNQIIAKMGLPFYNVPGNHDMNFDAADDRHSLETFKRHFGPTYYSFDYGDVHFVALDDVEFLGLNAETGEEEYRGAIGEKQLAWLSNDLQFVPEDRLIVLMMHIPLYNSQSDHQRINVADRQNLFALLKNRQHLLAIAGHLHQVRHDFLDAKTGWEGETPLQLISCAAVCGSWWGGPQDDRGIPIATQTDGTPNGYHIFSFKDATWTQKYYAAGEDRDEQMRIISPVGTIAQSDLDSTKIAVNVFNGSPQSSVRFQINGAATAEMQRTPMQDDFFAGVSAANKGTYKWDTTASISEHIWSAPMPTDLTPGMHIVTIETRDQHGNVYSASSIFEVK